MQRAFVEKVTCSSGSAVFAWDTVLDMSVSTMKENIFEEIIFSCIKLLASDNHLKIRDLWEIWAIR